MQRSRRTPMVAADLPKSYAYYRSESDECTVYSVEREPVRYDGSLGRSLLERQIAAKRSQRNPAAELARTPR